MIVHEDSCLGRLRNCLKLRCRRLWKFELRQLCLVSCTPALASCLKNEENLILAWLVLLFAGQWGDSHDHDYILAVELVSPENGENLILA